MLKNRLSSIQIATQFKKTSYQVEKAILSPWFYQIKLSLLFTMINLDSDQQIGLISPIN